jgi:prepilin-type N-terminal cleavage/methylation domain-containing protein
MLKLNNKGFSLIEALIAIAILAIAITGLVAMQGKFAEQSADRVLLNSLIDAASSALTHCQNVQTTPPSSYTYENNLIVSVRLNGNCYPADNTCNEVTATASAKNKSFQIKTIVCNIQ